MIEDYVDKTYVINLDERRDRWDLLVPELLKVGIKHYERFSAIKPERAAIPKEAYQNMRLGGADHDKYIVGTVGVRASHVEIMKKAREAGHKQILILEDDVEFHQDANAIFDSAMEQAKDIEWDMLFLGCNHKAPFDLINTNLARVKRAHAIHAYLIKNNMFDIIIENVIPSGQEIDVYYYESIHPNYTCLCTRPHTAWQRAGFSDLLQGNRNYSVLRR